MFNFIILFIVIIFAISIGGFIFNIIRTKGNVLKVIGTIIFILGFVVSGMFTIMAFINGPCIRLMFIPFIGIFVSFIGFALIAVSNHKGSSNKNTVRQDRDGNIVFGEDDLNEK